MTSATAPIVGSLVPTDKRGYSTAWWGMVSLIATESMVFVILLGSYFFLRATSTQWPLGGIPHASGQFSGITFRVEGLDTAGNVIASDEKQWIV